MLDLPSLQSLFFSRIKETSSLFDQSVLQFFEKNDSPPSEILDECQWHDPFLSEEKSIKNWQRLLAVNLFCHLSDSFRVEIGRKVREFGRHPWNQSSQYFRSLIALNHALAKMPVPEVGPHLLESGAALIDLHEYCPWLSLPYTPQHFEFGIYLCMLAFITKRDDLKDNVLRIANWQLNTLDLDGKPLCGLFVRENEGSALQHVCLNYLLFRSAALLSEETPFAALAERSLQNIQSYAEKEDQPIDVLWILIEKWLDQYRVVSQAPLELSENIHDTSTALVGYRSPSQHVVCTLHGAHTGLGELHFGDIAIVNYGPQYLPLGECKGFGIEGNALSDHGIRRSTIESSRGAFILKGCTRMVDQPSSSLFGIGDFRGIWLEVVQEFKRPHFYLKTTFLGLDGWESVAFSFFINAKECNINSQTIKQRTLHQYDGEAQTLILEGNEQELELRPLSFKGRMQVIPLAGGNVFWGADFLVSYLMNHDQRHYQWHIGPPR